MSRVVLLGPLEESQDMAAEVAAFEVDGPVALITAGWEEGERNDAELDRRLGGGTRNLGLYGRRLDILESDPDYAAAERRVRAQLADLRELYLLRLRHALAGAEAVSRRFAGARRRLGAQLDAPVGAVRALDDAHAAAMAAVYAGFHASLPPHERDVIRSHREEVAAMLAECAAVAVAGGHVGVLNDCLHLCHLGALLGDRPVLAWSSGSMALAGRIFVLDDSDPAERPDELYDTGVGVVRGIVPLPVAAGRLRLRDPDRLAVLARRCAPALPVLLNAGDRLELRPGHPADLSRVGVATLDGRLRRGMEAA